MNALVEWLRDSGIKYPRNKSEKAGTDIVDMLPHELVIENSRYPLARFYRTGFWASLADTYYVIKGRHFDSEGLGHGSKGLLDITVLPLISRKLLYWAHNPNTFAPLRGFCLLTAIPIELTRTLAAAGATIAVSPVVLGLNLITMPRAYQLSKQAESLSVIPLQTPVETASKHQKPESTSTISSMLFGAEPQADESQPAPRALEATTLKAWLQSKNAELNQLRKDPASDTKHPRYFLSSSARSDQGTSYYNEIDGIGRYTETITVSSDTSETSQNAFDALNLGAYTSTSLG